MILDIIGVLVFCIVIPWVVIYEKRAMKRVDDESKRFKLICDRIKESEATDDD